jgi:hypothetical protein
VSTILEALAVIKGKDATGGAFDAVAHKIDRIARAANALNRDVNKQLATAKHAEVAATRLGRASASIGTGVKAAAGAAAVYEGSRAVKAIVHETVKATADRGHERVRMSVSGMPEDQIKEAAHLAGDISKRFPSVSQTEMMHMARNVRSMVGTFEEATHVLEPLAKLRVVALGAHPEKAEQLNEDFDKLAKGMEIKGVTQHMDQFHHYIDGMAKAINVFGDTLRPTDYYEMFKYGRAATTALSDDFMLKTAPTLAQELGGSSAGKAMSSFYTQFVGGKMSNKAVEQLQKYGMLDESKVIKTSTGNVKGVLPGGVIGSEYLQPGKTDPYMWVNKVLLPHLASKGVTEPAQIQEVIAAMASQATSAQMMAIFATQQKRIEKDWELVHKADGIEAADKYQKNDPKVIRKAIEAQADNALGNLGEKFLPATNKAGNWLTSGLSYMAEQADKDPLRVGAGLGWGGLVAGAIGADSLSSSLGAAGELLRGGKAVDGIKFGLTKLALALAPIVDIATRSDVLDPAPFKKKYGILNGDKFDSLGDLDRDDATIGRTDFGDGSEKFVADLRAKNAAKRAALEAELTSLGYAGAGVPGRGLMAGQISIDDIRKATGIGGESVKAEVVGNATLETVVKIEPSPDFLARIEQKVTNAINAFRSSGGPSTGSTGSTGRSMPEASPPQ